MNITSLINNILQQVRQRRQMMFHAIGQLGRQNTQANGCLKSTDYPKAEYQFEKVEDHQELKSTIIQNCEDDGMDEQIMKNKTENKLKYRRLKQKLTTMCEEYQEKCLIKQNKEVSSPNKSRLLTLGIQFEKMTLNQTKDYPALQSKLREVLKILDHKRQHDLLILRHSKLISSLCLLLKKVPAFHKNQFTQSLRSIELGLKLLRIFCTLASNRDYMISTNQVAILNSCLSSFYNKQDKKMSIQCLGVLHEILASRIKADSQQIIVVSTQIVFFGQLSRKIRQGIQSCFGEDNSLIEEQFVLKSLKYLHTLYRKYFQRALNKPIHLQPQIPQYMQQNSDALLIFIEVILPALILEKQGTVKDDELPICIINICLYILKLLNLNAHVNIETATKVIDFNEKSLFTVALKWLFEYAKESIEQGQQIHEIKCIYSEIIIFLGKICCTSSQIKINLRNAGLVDMLFNHPLIYIMDDKLKSILMPSLCSILLENEGNIKKFLEQNSSQEIIKFLKQSSKLHKQLHLNKFQQQEACSDIEPVFSEEATQTSKPQTKICKNSNKALTRTSSVSSLNSYTTQCTQNSHTGYFTHKQQQRDNNRLLNMIPFIKWEPLMEELIRLDN